MVGIYKITNPKGKIYIGQSVNIERRKKEYSKINCKRQKYLYYSLQKYGWEQHKFEVLEECTPNMLNKREKYWGNFYNVLEEGLNHRLGKGRGSVSEETKKKIGKANSRPKPKGFAKKISKARIGYIRSEKSKLQQGKKLKGRISPNKGNKWSEKQKKQLGKPILQYDFEGNLIKEWYSATEAQSQLKIKGINNNLKGRCKTCGGFIWKYK